MPRVRTTQNEYSSSAVGAVESALDSSGTNTGNEFGNWLLDLLDFSGARAASKQVAAQAALQDQSQAFNATQAAANRAWEERMSNTAHQREVADLQAAGLNPWLSAGAGAAAQSAPAASSGEGQAAMANNKLASILGAVVLALITKKASSAKSVKAASASKTGSAMAAAKKAVWG